MLKLGDNNAHVEAAIVLSCHYNGHGPMFFTATVDCSLRDGEVVFSIPVRVGSPTPCIWDVGHAAYRHDILETVRVHKIVPARAQTSVQREASNVLISAISSE